MKEPQKKYSAAKENLNKVFLKKNKKGKKATNGTNDTILIL